MVNFATSTAVIVDTGDKFAIGGVPWAAYISANFWKNSKQDTQELGAKLIREENLQLKISWHCPFKAVVSLAGYCLEGQYKN